MSVRTTLWRALLSAGAGLALASGAGAGAAYAAPSAQAGPVLAIGDVSAGATAPIDVPIQFTANGASISTLLFSIDYDQAALTLDPADADDDGIPDALVFKLPAGLMVSATLDPSDADSELDVLITGMRAPLPAIPDGAIIVMTFQPRAGAASGPSTSVRFASTPAPSFGSTTGQSIAGSAKGGTVRWTTGSAGSAGSVPTIAPGGARAPTTVPAAPGAATPRSSQDRGAAPTSGAEPSGESGATAVAPAAAPVGDSGAAAAAGAAAAGGLGDVADPLGAMPFIPAMTAMSQALGDSAAAGVPAAALDSAGATTASDTDAMGGTAAPSTELAALPPATGDTTTGGTENTDVSDPPPSAAGSSSRIWLLTIVVAIALAGGWLAYRRRGGGGLHAE